MEASHPAVTSDARFGRVLVAEHQVMSRSGRSQPISSSFLQAATTNGRFPSTLAATNEVANDRFPCNLALVNGYQVR